MDITLVKDAYGQLVAFGADDKEKLKHIKMGEPRKYKSSKPRNLMFHKKFIALCNILLENTNKYSCIEGVMDELKLKTGHYKLHITLKGNPIYIPKSISFVKMEQGEFEIFFNKCVSIAILGFGMPESIVDELIYF